MRDMQCEMERPQTSQKPGGAVSRPRRPAVIPGSTDRRDFLQCEYNDKLRLEQLQQNSFPKGDKSPAQSQSERHRLLL